MRGLISNTLRNVLAPQRAWHAYHLKVNAFEAEITGNVDHDLPLAEFARTYTQRLWPDMFEVTLPALFAGLLSPRQLIPRRLAEANTLAEKLRKGFVGNLVVEQGMALFRMARPLDRGDFDDLNWLAERIEKREMPDAFLRQWDAFLRRFGCRGPHEMDLASPRYADDPTLMLSRCPSWLSMRRASIPTWRTSAASRSGGGHTPRCCVARVGCGDRCSGISTGSVSSSVGPATHPTTTWSCSPTRSADVP